MKRVLRSAMATFALVLGLTAAVPAQESQSFGFSFGTAPSHSWIGVSIRDITPDLMKSKDLKSDDGAYINDVVRRSPADSAGLREGDVIVKFNGRDINDAEDIVRAVRKLKPGTHVAIEILRENNKKDVALTIARVPRERRSRVFSVGPGIRGMRLTTQSEVVGLRLSKLNTQLGEYFQAPDGRGVLVEEVEQHSSGGKAGFKAGDVIVKIGNDRVGDVGDIEDALQDLDEGDKVDFGVMRKGSSMTITVQLTDKDMSFLELPAPPPHPGGRFGMPDGSEEFLEMELPSDPFAPAMEELQIRLQDAARKIQVSSGELDRRVRSRIERLIGRCPGLISI